MKEIYDLDKIDNENPDLNEEAGRTFLFVPFTMWTLLIFFGIAYMLNYTKNGELSDGDSRTPRTVATAVTNDPELGANIYKKRCQACHQPTGKGLGNSFPPLAGSEWVQGDEDTVAAILLHGISGEIEVEGRTFKGAMPPFGKVLKPAEIAAVTSYVRSSWGNSAPAISVETVEKIQKLTTDRKTPWKGGAELKEKPWSK